MKGCVQWSPIYSWKYFCIQQILNSVLLYTTMKPSTIALRFHDTTCFSLQNLKKFDRGHEPAVQRLLLWSKCSRILSSGWSLNENKFLDFFQMRQSKAKGKC